MSIDLSYLNIKEYKNVYKNLSPVELVELAIKEKKDAYSTKEL